MRSVTRRSRMEHEMRAEIDFHLESYAADLVRGGMSREQAMRRARIEFGAVESKKEDCRASLGLRLWDELRADVRYAARVMRKSPGFALVAVLTLALGIGANTAIFTLVDAILLRLVPVQQAQQLYQVKRFRVDTPVPSGSFTHVLWENVRLRQEVFSGMAAWGNTQFDLSRGGAVQRAEGLWVSGDYFETLAVRPAVGRLIVPSDDFRGCPAIAVLSHNFWRDHYGASPSVIGSTISLNMHPFEVVGVTESGFTGLDLGSRFDVAAPACATAWMDGKRSRLDARSWWWLTLVGRAKPGVSAGQVTANLAAIAPAVFGAAIPQNWDAAAQKRFEKLQLSAVPAGSGVSWGFRESYRRPLTILMIVVALVLLIACANIAALMLARAAAQNRELAVRLALGASRARIARQLLTHAVMLAAAGASLGAIFASWGTRLLVRGFSTHGNSLSLDLSPDWRMVVFTTAVALLTAGIFGILPAIRSARVPIVDAMRGSTVSQTDRRSPLRKWIVASQIALSLVLLVTAGLFLRSFAKLLWLDPGFDKRNVLLVNANLKSTSIPPEQQFRTFDEIESRLRALPGVVSVGRSHLVPLGNSQWDNYVVPDTPNPPKPSDSDTYFNFVSPGYFGAMRMTLLAGRNFTSADSKTSAQVVVVNQAFVRKFYSNLNPVGHVIRIPGDKNELGPPIEIVGVVADSKYATLREEIPATAFFPLSQVPQPEFEDTFAVRTAARPQGLIPAVENAVAGLNGAIPLDFNTLEQQVDDAMVQERLLAMLSGFFGAIAVLLAMVGLYGAVSYRVTLRRTEFGIRMALGAQVSAIVRLVIREVAVIVAVGVAAGIAISFAATQALQKLLFGLGPRDAITMAGAAAILSAVALLAAFAPARRAARVDPMVALRYE